MTADRRFDILARIVEIANTSVDVDERLQGVMGVIHGYMEARQSVLFLQDKAKQNLVEAHAWPRAGQSCGMMTAMSDSLLGEVTIRRKPMALSGGDPTGDAIVDGLRRPGETALLLPVCGDSYVFGVLALILPEGSRATDERLRLLQAATREMAGTMRNDHLYMDAKKRIAELNAIKDLGLAAISTMEVDELLDTVAGTCAKLLGAKAGLIMVKGAGRVFSASYGPVPSECHGEDLCGMIDCNAPASQLKPFFPACNGKGSQTTGRERLCMPLGFKGAFSGNLCVFEKVALAKGAAPGFNFEDQNLLGALASMAAPALENAMTFHRLEDMVQRNEEMVSSLGTLHEISTSFLTTVDFDETVMIILHAVVHPAGLNYDHAVLFLADEPSNAVRAVADLDQASLRVQGELRQTLLALKEARPLPPMVSDPRFSGLSAPLSPSDNPLARCLAQRKVLCLVRPDGNPNANGALPWASQPFSALAAPMIAKDKPVGVLVAANDGADKVIGEREEGAINMLANQAAQALETSRLYQNLENANRELAHMRGRLLEADRLAALGEIAAGVAHEIRNPLVSIGGFARRVRNKLGDESPLSRYLDVVIEEATRLERTLNEMLDFSTDSRDHHDEYDLGEIMDRSVGLLQRDLDEKRIKVARDYAADLPRVYCDERQIKHVFLNLYLNAVQAMERGGTLTLRTFTVIREAKKFVAGEVSDTGGGIPMDVIHNIFNPFFTTKDNGSGMGLSIVHKIVTRHLGGVEVHNREGEGASFLVTLPAAEEGRAYLK